jgi:carbonic anhydrase
MSQMAKLPRQDNGFDPDDRKVHEPTGLRHEPARRRFLQLAAGGAFVGWIGTAVSQLSFPEPAFAQSTLNPDAALAELMAGNGRFVNRNITSDAQDLTILKQNNAEKQEPFAAVLSCADSRVPAELVFDQTIGHIFVTRVAGNVATSEIIASLEYGAAVLGTKVILVMGHAGCGAVKATIQGAEVPGQSQRPLSPYSASSRSGRDQSGRGH